MENWLRDNPEGGSNHEYSLPILRKRCGAARCRHDRQYTQHEPVCGMPGRRIAAPI